MGKVRWFQPEKLDLAVTILYALFAVCGIAVLVFLFRSVDLLWGMTQNSLSDMPSGEGVVDGYLVLGKLIGGGLGVLAGFAMLVFGVICAVVTVVFAIVAILGAVWYRRFLLTGDYRYIRRNLRIKVVLQTIVMILAILLVFDIVSVTSIAMILIAGFMEGALIYGARVCSIEYLSKNMEIYR